jgi:hypothetical protein
MHSSVVELVVEMGAARVFDGIFNSGNSYDED